MMDGSIVADAEAKLVTVRSLIASRRTWLNSFSSGRNRRPEHEIVAKRRELVVLEAIAEDYRKRISETAA
jgi:hypothetical protein